MTIPILYRRVTHGNTRWLAWLLIAVVAMLVFVYSSPEDDYSVPELLQRVAVDPPKPLTAVKLVDHNNNLVDITRFENSWTFVFFGFTHCPDVCPATLAQLTVLKKEIMNTPGYNDNVQFFFVSVDPQRDTTAHLSDYIKYFDPDFVGVTGDQNSISSIEKQLDAYHRIGAENARGGYTVDHSSEIYLIDPAARLTARFMPPMDSSRVTEQLFRFMSLYSRPAV